MSETFWNGNDIGNIDGVAFNFDLVYGKRIFYSSFFGGIYFFIDSYTPFGHYIETLKYLFEIAFIAIKTFSEILASPTLALQVP